jgi:biopolymer transport protein ExbD
MLHRGFSPAHAYAPNLAPMVDVVMVILVFFMLGTSLAVTEGVLPTELPSQIGPQGEAEISIVPTVRIYLWVSADGAGCRIRVMDEAMPTNSFSALRAYLRDKRIAGADPTGRVLITAESEVTYQSVISAMDACVRAGFSNIQFSVSLDVTAGAE